jgi:hypothetical protein
MAVNPARPSRDYSESNHDPQTHFMSKGTLFPHLNDSDSKPKLELAETEIARLHDIIKIQQKQIERLMDKPILQEKEVG